MRRIACLLLIVLCGAVWAQDGKVYKIVHPDGRVTYTDKPTADQGARTRELAVDPGTAGIQMMDPGKAQEVNTRIKAGLEERDKRALEEQRAREKLREAERAKEAGEEPLAGERTGIVGKKGARTRLSEDYTERQEKLDEDVNRARKAAE
jgi:hypothetical protein